MINLKRKYHSIDFKDLDSIFAGYFNEFSSNKSLHISEYFSKGVGRVGALKKLSENKIITSPNDFQGVYVFYKNATPFYVGISKHVIYRIIQHVKGKNHFTSSLCYRLGADRYIEINGNLHTGGREGLIFKEFGEAAKIELMKCNVAFYKVENTLELYLFEVYLAMKFGTLYYNQFKTH